MTDLRIPALPALLTLALLPVVVLAACDRDEEDVAVPPRMVEVAEVVADDASLTLTILGDVHGETEVRVFSQLPERVREVHVEDGQGIEEGEPLVTLEADLPASEVGQASAALLAAEATRDQIQADLTRISGLVASHVLPASRSETLTTQLRSAEARVEQLRAARRAAGQRRDRTVIRAPADGMVALLAVDDGDMVSPQMPVCLIVQMDRVDVHFSVVESDYVRLEVGMQVTVTPPALPDLHRAGQVTRISPVIDPLTRTATVEVRLDNPDHTLRPGMVAEVAIDLERRTDVTMVPARAVLMTTRTDTAREGYVFVVDGDTARRRPVFLGQRYGERMEITRGLEPGEQIVVLGQHVLRDGSAIRVRDAATEAAAPEPVAPTPLAIDPLVERP